MQRRSFIKTNGIAGLGALILPSSVFSGSLSNKKVKVGLIATGFRGQVHLNELLRRNDVEVTAIADPDYFLINDFIECIKANKEFPFDVYDLAT